MIFVLLALFNGVLIALARILNGKLSSIRNAFYASWINHLVGFVALSLLMLSLGQLPTSVAAMPPILLFGGVIGALYVTINAYVVPKLGVTLATLLVIAGQIVMSVLLDVALGNIVLSLNAPVFLLGLGSFLLVAGFFALLRAE